jgi:hypothetical protein
MTEQEAMQILADMGLHEGGMDNWVPDNAWYRFANVVEAKARADERDRATRENAYVLAEREACAKVCEELPAPDIYSNTDKSMWDVTCIDCATAIRARGTT